MRMTGDVLRAVLILLALVLLPIGAAAGEAVPEAAPPSPPAVPAVPAAEAPSGAPSAEPANTEPIQAEPTKPADPQPPAAAQANTRAAICLMIESAAKAHDLPLEFFARVIWQESRFQPGAIGPVTRSGQRAQGIAQFMPGTASERRLLDPFDPVQALPKSAEFLAELRDRFGNLGLAAAAYNAGPRRVQEWIAGTGPMPLETRNYVLAITGASVDDWASGAKAKAPETPSPRDCRSLMALLDRAPNLFVSELAQRVKLGVDRPWGVQLAAGFNRDRALMSYARAMTKLSSVIGDQDPSLLGSLFRSRGTRTFYQVRIGTDTREAANELCTKIRRAGSACLVLRNRPG
ncbi:sporulation related protein [Rhodopseudomonas faecalis]|uniref:Sporulation related protein n=2 Tax=Rhodopseudomonas faecalis TaxID=99655 RepID=A0A318THP2_9BRAD|nr:sporulation related protein [Rhodopseudomonas faecalis]